jgi:hypothetical protein
MDFQHYLNVVLDFFREGFQSVNYVQGLIIAVIAAFMLADWGGLFAIALGATIVHLIANIIIPVVANHAAFKLPDDLMQLVYWRHALALFVGYVIVIGVFFFIKNMVTGGSRGMRHAL